jgi:heme/copper-type cytochrome/quinol oxidase subunit 3
MIRDYLGRLFWRRGAPWSELWPLLAYLFSIAKGLRPAVLRRLLCWSLFWHALDIVWVGVFTLVYLMGDFR